MRPGSHPATLRSAAEANEPPRQNQNKRSPSNELRNLHGVFHAFRCLQFGACMNDTNTLQNMIVLGCRCCSWNASSLLSPVGRCRSLCNLIALAAVVERERKQGRKCFLLSPSGGRGWACRDCLLLRSDDTIRRRACSPLGRMGLRLMPPRAPMVDSLSRLWRNQAGCLRSPLSKRAPGLWSVAAFALESYACLCRTDVTPARNLACRRLGSN